MYQLSFFMRQLLLCIILCIHAAKAEFLRKLRLFAMRGYQDEERRLGATNG